MQDDVRFRHFAESARSRRLAGEPNAFAIFVNKIEFRIAVPGNPNGSGGNAFGAADGNKQRCQFFAVARFVAQGGKSSFDRTVFIRDFVVSVGR